MSFPRIHSLDPLETASELLFAVIMTLSVTAAVAIGNKTVDTHELLVAAFGCNIAWGFVDAVVYLINARMTGARKVQVRNQLISAPTPEAFRAVLDDVAPEGLMNHLDTAALQNYREFVGKNGALVQEKLTLKDWRAAGAIWLLDTIATLPLVLPFLFIDAAQVALRTTQLVAIVMMFWLGIGLGRWVGYPPVRMGFSFAALGAAVAIICIALGG
ncbi:hypothetical protein [Chitinibacter sp. S2-10]|uniref:hypothetical protein n=1 Tax=Chitinibacter sp. S2-10 TaxID=3373597 RepID=UPI0039775982